MGTFLSMTSIVGKTKAEVVNSLEKYAAAAGGGLLQEALPIEHPNCCVIEEAAGNTTLFNPDAFLEWDKQAEAISKDLNAPVFSFHIHDGDLWMYVLFVNGAVADRFNPVPDYWDEDLPKAEMRRWKGNAATVVKYVPSVKPAAIERYLVRWDPDADDSEKAYPDDEYEQEDWQLLDFMRKLGLPYPLHDNGTPKGETYKLWTSELQLQEGVAKKERNRSKPWWKIW